VTPESCGFREGYDVPSEVSVVFLGIVKSISIHSFQEFDVYI
jgi:hypothetical protein